MPDKEKTLNFAYMGTAEVINEIKRLPLGRRMLIAEKILKSVRENETKKNFQKAINVLLDDYLANKELTAFSALDASDFYEAR